MADVELNVVEDSVKSEEQKEKLDFAQYVQQQLTELREQLKSRLNEISTRFPISSEDLISLKDTLKVEFSHIIEDLTQTSKEIKQELTEISLKHKDHLSETFKHSKDQTVEAFSKINLSQLKDEKKALEAVE